MICRLNVLKREGGYELSLYHNVLYYLVNDITYILYFVTVFYILLKKIKGTNQTVHLGDKTDCH